MVEWACAVPANWRANLDTRLDQRSGTRGTICNLTERRLLGEPLLQQWLREQDTAQKAKRPAQPSHKSSQESTDFDSTPLSVDWWVLGHRFIEYFAMADFGTDVRWAFSPSSTPAAMAASLVALGYTITQEVVPMPKEPGRHVGRGDVNHQLPTPVQVATRQTRDSGSRIILAAGYYPLMHGVAEPKAPGLTLICAPTEPNEQELERLIGIWSTSRIAKVVSAKGTLPVDMIERILSSGYPGPLQILARYHDLTPAQIDRLLALDTILVDQRLVENPAVALSETQINALVSRRNHNVGYALIMHRLSRLTPAQRKTLGQDPHLAELLVIRQGGRPALTLLRQQLSNHPDIGVLV